MLLSAGLVGLVLSYALSLTGLLSGLVSSFTQTEAMMVSVERLEEYSCDIPQGAPRPAPAGVFALLPWAKVEEAKELEGQAVRSDHHSFGGRAEKAGQGSRLRVELPFPSHVVDLRESDTKVNCEWLGHIAQMRSPVAKYNRPKPQAAPRTACQARGPGAHGVWEYSSQEALI